MVDVPENGVGGGSTCPAIWVGSGSGGAMAVGTGLWADAGDPPRNPALNATIPMPTAPARKQPTTMRSGRVLSRRLASRASVDSSAKVVSPNASGLDALLGGTVAVPASTPLGGAVEVAMPGEEGATVETGCDASCCSSIVRSTLDEGGGGTSFAPKSA